MDCGRVRKKLSLYIDEEVLPEEQQAIHEHLETCLSCQREMEKLFMVKQLLRAVGKSLEAGVPRKVALDFRYVAQRERFGKFVAVSLFSLIAIVVILALVFWQGVREGADLRKEITPVSMLVGFDSKFERIDSSIGVEAIQVVEFTLD